jgi:hypothetical protein
MIENQSIGARLPTEVDAMARSQTMARRRMARAIPPQTCSVCGGADVAVDEVFERGLWLLAECRRCENQWTEGPLGGSRGPVTRAFAVIDEEQVAAA